MVLRFILAFSLLTVSTVSTTALADTIDLNVRDSSAQIQYRASMGRDTLGRAEAHAGLLYVDKDNLLTDLGILVQDEVGGGTPNITVGVGLKALTGKAKGFDTAAVALGGLVRVAPFTDTRFSIIGHLYLSPNIITFGDADRYTEANVLFDYEIIPQASAYVGYRKIEFGLEKVSDVVLEEGAYLGVKIIF